MQRVVVVGDGHRVEGCGSDGELVNQFLAHLGSRAFSPATVRAYAYDLLNFLRFLAVRNARLADVVATDLFDYLDWQQRPAGPAGPTVVRLGAGRGAMPATMNRRIAAARGLFEFAVMAGARADNPVPAARRSSGLRASRRGLLGHIGPGRPRAGGRLVRQPQRLPESLEPDDVTAFLVNLLTSRDRAITLAMLLGGLRAAEVRSLRLADVDMGMRRLRVTGKAARNASSRLMARSSPNWLPTCVMNVPPGAARRNASSYCAARPPGSRSPRRGCGGSSAPTGWLRGRCEYGRTGCAIPTEPSSRARASICWRCGS